MGEDTNTPTTYSWLGAVSRYCTYPALGHRIYSPSIVFRCILPLGASSKYLQGYSNEALSLLTTSSLAGATT